MKINSICNKVGWTAWVALIANCKVYVANIGDSRWVLSNNKKVI